MNKRRERYPDSNVLGQSKHWDEATRRVVLDRVHRVPPYRHFGLHQRATLEALCARVISQSHRPSERQVPIAPWIDQKCFERGQVGHRFEDMPPDDIAWAWGLEGLDHTAEANFGKRFVDLDRAQQDDVLQAIRSGSPPGEIWQRMPARRWWIYVALREITGIYYAHSYAWDEIGFGGPAYPRGYFALNHGAPEPWEAREVTSEKRGESS